MEFLLVAAAILVAWQILSSRLRKLRGEIDELRRDQARIPDLIKRVYLLEQAFAARTAAPEPAHVSEPARAPEPVRGPEPPVVEAPPAAAMPARAGVDQAPPTLRRLEPDVVAPAPVVREPETIPFAEPRALDFEPARPSLRRRFAASIAGKEWESMLGGNLLNKVGVLVLIIGIGLFLGYSFTRMGPAGRVATALAVSLTMLAGGIVLERRSLYRIFGRGLIGGGWAGVYFTTYAAYAVDAARVITNAWIASALLAIVAAGVIVHSLKYRSQTVSGLAYFVAFATFGLTPVTSFSVLALFPLAASLLYLSYRFDWYKMALFGVLATYATCASRGDSGASVLATQAVIGGYWLLFEIFTVLRASRPGRFSIPEQWIFPLNTAGLLALSLPKWQSAARHDLWMFAAGFAAASLAGAIVRAMLRPPSADPETRLLPRMASGGYEGPLTLAAAALACSFMLRLDHVWINVGLLVEGMLLAAAGWRLRQTYVHRLGAAVFGVALVKLLLFDAGSGAVSRYGRFSIQRWTPVALLTAGCLYLSRYLTRARYFSYGAALALMLILGYEVPPVYVAAAWTALAVALFEPGLRKRLIEFRLQSYGLIVGAVLALFANNIFSGAGREHAWIAAGIATVFAYWLAMRIARSTGELESREAAIAPVGLAIVTTVFATAFAGFAASVAMMGAAWIALAALMLNLGLNRLPWTFRRLCYAPLLLGWSHVFLTGVLGADKNMSAEAQMNLGIGSLLSYAMSAGVFVLRERWLGRERRWLYTSSSWAGTAFAATVLWVALPYPVVAVAWTVLALALMEFGLGFGAQPLVVQADLLAILTFGRLFLSNFANVGETFGVSHRVLTIVPIIAAWYYSWWRRGPGRAARLYVYAAPLAALLLMRFEFGRVLTVVGWAAMMVILYRIGLRRRDFDFRLQAYVVGLLCFWRSWTTNFYAPDSLAGMPGRIATAALVVFALYCAEFIAPRGEFGDRRFERYARGFFSVLATALVTALLYYEVSGGMLTVAWGVEAVCLLIAGFAARERVLRLSGLALFLVCILKLFVYDLRHLETMNRILSFIILGAVMVAVSWVYTRFRGQIQKYL